MFSLLKTILEVLIAGCMIFVKKREERELRKKLWGAYENKLIKPDSKCYVLMRNIIILRREARFNLVEFMIYSFRMVLLIKSLRLTGHSVLNPIFVSLCGFS